MFQHSLCGRALAWAVSTATRWKERSWWVGHWRQTMERAIELVIYRDGQQWVAQALNVDVSSFGDTPDEARAALREALELYFEDTPDVEVPEVTDSRVEHLRV